MREQVRSAEASTTQTPLFTEVSGPELQMDGQFTAIVGQFTSDLLTNLARRNQSLLYRQLDIINQLEESEEDPDALAELFRLDHIATRVRRNAENLLVLSGEQSPRTWSEPVALRDVPSEMQPMLDALNALFGRIEGGRA